MTADSLDMAITRFAAASEEYRKLGGVTPYLPAFIAGYMLRVTGAKIPTREQIGQFWSSFSIGWREADESLRIEARSGRLR